MTNDTKNFDSAAVPLELALRQHLLQSAQNEAPQNLAEKIYSRLALEQTLAQLRVRLWAAVGALAGTLALFGFAVLSSYHAFAQTTTVKYLSLMFTDFKVVLDNWQDYASSVLETLPLGTLAFTLGALLAFSLAAEYVIKQWQNFSKQLTLRARK